MRQLQKSRLHMNTLLWPLLLQCVGSVYIDKYDGGYTDLLVSIHKSVPYDESIAENLKALLRDSSEFLHLATHGRVYIKSVIIDFPHTWPMRSNATLYVGDRFEGSDVRVTPPESLSSDNRLSTFQPRECGDPGEYISVPSQFLTELYGRSTKDFGNPAYTFVHEWAHFRYGVFDEYGAADSKNYSVLYRDEDGKMRANACQGEILFTARTKFGKRCTIHEDGTLSKGCIVRFHHPSHKLMNSSVMFMPYLEDLSQFCEGDTGANGRYVLASNKRSELCGGKSAWEVITSNDDFRGLPPPDVNKTPHPHFTEIQQSNDTVPSMVYVIDVSSSMLNSERLEIVKCLASRRIEDVKSMSLKLGIVAFDHTATTQHSVLLVNNTTKASLIDSISRLEPQGYTCIGCGLGEALQALLVGNVTIQGATLVLLTDGEETAEPLIEHVLPELLNNSVVVNTLALGEQADDKLENLALLTRGVAHKMSDLDAALSARAEASFIVSTTAQLDERERPVQIINEDQVTIWPSSSYCRIFHIGEELGRDTVVYIATSCADQNTSVMLRAQLIRPNGSHCTTSCSETTVSYGQVKIKVQSPAMPGCWKLSVYSSLDRPVNISVRVLSNTRNQSSEPIRLKSILGQKGNITDPTKATIYAKVTKGVHILLDVDVVAEVLRPGNPHAAFLQLFDDGLGADQFANDGIYSGYFTNFSGAGRYPILVKAKGSNKTYLASRRRDSGSLTITSNTGAKAGIPVKSMNVDNSHYEEGIPEEVSDEIMRNVIPTFERVDVVGSFQVFTDLNEESAPPGRIRDLKVIDTHPGQKGQLLVNLTWTWPGGQLDHGKAQYIDLRTSQNVNCLRTAFFNQMRIRIAVKGNLNPRVARTPHSVEVEIPASVADFWNFDEGTVRKVYIAAVVVNQYKLKSKISNIAVASNAPPVEKVSAKRAVSKETKTITIMLIFGGATALVILGVITVAYLVFNSKKGKWTPTSSNQGESR